MSPKHFRKEMVLKRGLDCFKPIAYTARQVTLIDVKDQKGQPTTALFQGFGIAGFLCGNPSAIPYLVKQRLEPRYFVGIYSVQSLS